MELLTSDWKGRMSQLLESATEDVLIVSPFITSVAATLLAPHLRSRRFNCRIITRWKLADFRQQASDHEALGTLIGLGAQVKAVKRLHAKAYLFDGQRAVVASANFTDGGLNHNLEWGILLTKGESITPDPFSEAESLWQRLTKVIGPADVASARERLQRFEEKYKTTVIGADDVLPDEGEDLADAPASAHPVPLKALDANELDAARAEVERIVASKARIGDAPDFKSLCEELKESKYTGISLQSFLWLVGYCNTGGSYGPDSEKHAKPLARVLFGYVPSNVFSAPGWNIDLKGRRYGAPISPQLEEAILASHRSRIGG